MQPRFFARPTDFRRWLERNAVTTSELVVGFRKVGSGRPSNHVGRGTERRTRPRAEPQIVICEDDQHAAARRRDRTETELPGISHGGTGPQIGWNCCDFGNRRLAPDYAETLEPGEVTLSGGNVTWASTGS